MTKISHEPATIVYVLELKYRSVAVTNLLPIQYLQEDSNTEEVSVSEISSALESEENQDGDSITVFIVATLVFNLRIYIDVSYEY